jgi:hypothetical protein
MRWLGVAIEGLWTRQYESTIGFALAFISSIPGYRLNHGYCLTFLA